MENRKESSTISPRHQFQQLYKKCDELGLTASDISSLPALLAIKSKYELTKPSKMGTLISITIKLVLSLVTLLCFTWFFNWPVHSDRIASSFLSLQGVSYKFHEKEECIVDMPNDVHAVFRPPLDCDFCTNVSFVPRISGINPHDFERLYAYSGRPIIVTDATLNWTAMETFNFEFFKSVHNKLLESENSDKVVACQFFPYKTKFKGLEDVFAMSSDKAYMKDGSPPWYIGWKNCDFVFGSILREHYSRPYFLPSTSESSKTDWIFMGSPGYGAHLHIDDVLNPSWQAQITGNKRWILEPPPECYYTCTSHIEVVVKPGEIMVINANLWYHQTIIEGDDIAIAIGSEYD